MVTLTALRDMHPLAATDKARLGSPRVDNSATSTHAGVHSDHSNTSDLRMLPRVNHTPVIDSLMPTAHSSETVTLSNHQQPAAAAALFALVFVGLCALVVAIFFLVRYFMRRAAIKRRRQASWILRSNHWNMEPKRANAHDTRTGCSDTSSSFMAYPYPLSEDFSK